MANKFTLSGPNVDVSYTIGANHSLPALTYKTGPPLSPSYPVRSTDPKPTALLGVSGSASRGHGETITAAFAEPTINQVVVDQTGFWQHDSIFYLAKDFNLLNRKLVVSMLENKL